MDLKIFQRAEDVDAASWARLNPTPRCTPAWFVTSEAYFRTTKHYYVTAWEEGRLRAILPLYDEYDPDYFNVTHCYDPVFRRLLSARPFLCVGSRLGLEGEVIGDQRFTEALLAAAEELSASVGADYLAISFRSQPLPAWDKNRLRFVFNRYSLRLTGERYEDYLAQFNAKKRHMLKDEVSKAAPVFQAPLAGNEKRFNELRLLSCHRQGGMNYLDQEFFEILAQEYGEENLVLLAAGTEQEWAGACLLLASEREFCALSIGVRERDHTYFSLMIHEPVKLAYATGRREIELGVECAEAKRRRGAEAVPLTAYLLPVSHGCRMMLATVAPATRFEKRVRNRMKQVHIHNGGRAASL